MIQYGTERKLSRSALAKQAWPYKFTIHYAIVQTYANQKKNRYCTPKLSRLQSEAQKISLSKLNFYKLKKSKVNFTQHRCINTVRTIIDVLGCIDNLEIPYLLKRYCKKSTCLTSQNRESNQRRKKNQTRKLFNWMF